MKTTKQNPSSAVIYVRLPVEDHERIFAVAKGEQRSASSLVRILVAEALAAREAKR